MSRFFHLNIKSFILVIGMLAVSNYSWGTDCFEKSPNYQALGDEYFNLDDEKKFSDKERDAIKDLLEKAEGKWVGFAKDVDCKGTDKAPRKEIKKSDLKVQANLNSSGDLVIRAEKYFSEDKIRKIQTIELLKGVRIFEFDFRNGKGFVFSERYRRSTANGRTRLVEIIKDIEVNDKSLVLKMSLFVNGVYVSEEVLFMSAV